MLARGSKLFFRNEVVAETPLLLPSFSSKGFPHVKKIMRLMGEFITSPVLVSAYDIHHGCIDKNITFSDLVFLDSGGYEARVDHDFSESYGWPYRPRQWNRQYHAGVLRDWTSKWPTVAVTYDSPNQYQGIPEQIESGRRLRGAHPDFLWELLLKPETKKTRFVSFEKVIKHVRHLRDFDIVGVTEKEIGDSLFDAMTKLARLRLAMDAADVRAPIHVFGSLDPLTSVLYFIAGAEIFDGLTWLRFGYHAGQTLYQENYSVLSDAQGIRRLRNDQVYAMWKNNYYYLQRLRTQMVAYVRSSGDASKFEHAAALIDDCHRQLEATVPLGR